MIRSIRLLWIDRIRRQPLRAVLAVVALAAGVGLTVAVLVETSSVTAANAALARRLSGPAPLRVVGSTARGGIAPGVVPRVAAVPGVAAAVPVVQAVGQVRTASGHTEIVIALGVDCRVEALIGDVGCDPARFTGTSIITSSRLAQKVGRAGVLTTDAGDIPLANAASLPALDRINGGDVIILPLATAQQRLGRFDRYDVIYVRTAPGTPTAALRARISAAAGPQNGVLAAGDPAPGVNINATVAPLLGVISLFALGIGALLVYNVTTLSLEERRRDLAVTAAIGAPRGLVVGGALAEAATLGVIGGIAGAGAGVVFAYPVVASISNLTARFGGVHLVVTVHPAIVIEAALLGLVTAMLAAIIPARRAARIEVAGELHGRAQATESVAKLRVRRGLIALLIGVGALVLSEASARGGGLSSWQGPAGSIGLFVSMASLFYAAAALTPVVIALLRRPIKRGTLSVAMANLTREPGRTSVVALAIGVAIGMAGVLASLIPSINQASKQFVTGIADGRIEVSTLAFNNTASIDAKISPRVVSALQRIPGVAAVDRNYFIITGTRTGHQVAVSTGEHLALAYPVLEGPPAATVFAHASVLIGPNLARGDGLHPGSILRLPTPHGMVAFHVGAVWGDVNNNGRSVTIPLDQALPAFGPQPPDNVLVRASPGVALPVLAARMRDAHLDPALQVELPSEAATSTAHDVANQIAPFWTLQRVMLLVAFIATLSTLLLVGVQRRREMGMLGAIGMAPGELLAMILLEAGVVAVVASVLGAIAGLGVFEALRAEATQFIGIHPPWGINPGPELVSAFLAVIVCLVGAAIPALRTARLEVVDALRYE